MHILMVAAENDALAGGKVGGIGDVVRDVPLALAGLGHRVEVLTPGYQAFSKLPGAKSCGSFGVEFQGKREQVEIFEVPGKKSTQVRNLVFEHRMFAIGGQGVIYHNDTEQPFASDARKFALFNAAVAAAICEGLLDTPDVIHLHDWHAAIVAVLRSFDARYQALKSIPTVFTIHNLALQGIRPLRDDESSLKHWFPSLKYDQSTVADPRYTDCFNPMRAGINLCDKVHAVSPTYANEIVKPSDYERGFFGGEGLELDLQRAQQEGRLVGILNGAEYPSRKQKPPGIKALLDLCDAALMNWMAKSASVESAHQIAAMRIAA